MSWEYRIALLASGEYPWVPCTEHEGLDIKRLGYVTLDSGIPFFWMATEIGLPR